ncbi:MAG: hypothetical protein ABL872_03025 [Lacibacter sp.]
MKTIFFTLLFTLNVTATFAQMQSDSSKHLTFKGVPIDGTLNEYVSKMKKSGFIQMKTEDGVAFLKGDFAAYKNCTLGVSTLKQKNLVSKIAVTFPDCDTWSALSSNYFNLKEMLTDKYGEPSECIEKFQSTTLEHDGYKMTQVQLDACKYYTIYKTEKGTIELSISHYDTDRCFVKLVYLDKINSETIKKEALSDL